MKLEGYTALFAERLIAALKQGTAPWQRPWEPGELHAPTNGTTSHIYTGSNSLMLRLSAMLAGYEDQRWAGFHQILKAGGRVRKGEKGTPVLVWRDRKQRDDNDKPTSEEETEDKRSFYAAFHYVFNVAQADDWDLPGLERKPPIWTPREIVEQVREDSCVKVQHIHQGQAYYIPSRDTVIMPERHQFPTRSGYEHTLLHELSHATMHESRLDRADARSEGKKGQAGYAIEELRAEISAMLLGEKLDVGHSPRHGEAYVANWIQALENDPEQVRRAAGEADRIARWLTREIDRSTKADETPAATAEAA